MRLEVKLLAARDLPKQNSRSRQMPYAVLQIKGMDDVRTQPVKSSRAPEWNESFILEDITASSLDITLTVMHKERKISDISFTLSDIRAGESLDQWIDLKGAEKGQKGGQIHVAFSFQEAKPQRQGIGKPVEEVHDEEEVVEEVPEEEEGPDVPMSPKSSRLERKILDDDKDQTEQERNEKVKKIAEIKRKAAEDAKQRYNSFLREKTPTLLDNEKRMIKYRAEIEENGSTENE